MKHPLQKLRQRLPELKRQMSEVRFSDGGQKRAFGNLARFFAVMLVLTLVARGTANATMPQVDAVHPMRGSITQDITLSGMVSAAGRTGVPCPAGVTVAELLVLPGEQVQAGQAIARFDEEEVERLLARAKVQMKKLAAQKQSQAEAGRQPDAGGVGSAQQALDWAYEDLRAAQDELARLEAAPEPDAAALAAARQAVQSATRTAQTAEAARDSALAAYQQAKQQAAAAAQSGGAGIEDLELDERETQQTIDDLAGLQADGCVLKAPAAGTLLAWNMAAGGASTSQACTLADAAQGHVLEAVLDKEAAKKAAVGAAAQVTQGNVKGQAAISALSAPGEDGSVTATIRLPGEEAWKEGVASAQIALSQTQHELCVPASAVGQDNQGYFVYLLEEKETVLGVQKLLVRTSVTIEERGTDTVAVAGALSQMDSVVSGSSKPLAAGARVKVRG